MPSTLATSKGPPAAASRVVADLAAEKNGVIVFALASFAGASAPGPGS
jgi:hypothetical protein